MLVFASSLILYIYTLIPSVAWGDGAIFQINAYFMRLSVGAMAHPLYIIIAKLFTLLPIQNVAYRVNLVSAIFGALTVMLVYLITVELTRSPILGFVSAISLALSHTFWLHSVIPEVLTLNSFFAVLVIYLLILYERKGDIRLIYAASCAYGLSLSNHLLMILLLPAILFMLVLCSRKYKWRAKEWALIIIFFLLGLSFYLYLLIQRAMKVSLYHLFDEVSGGSFKKEMFTSPLRELLRSIVKFGAYLMYQFPLFGFILGFIGLWHSFKFGWWRTTFLLLCFLGNTIFTLNYSVKDQFVFYITSYAVFAIWIGLGADWLWQKIKSFSPAKIITVILLVLTPVLLYHSLPWMIRKFDVDIGFLQGVSRGRETAKVRGLPRDEERYFLVPSKLGEYSAANYGKVTLDSLTPEAIIIADWNPNAVLIYFQQVEGRRPDVTIVNNSGVPTSKQMEIIARAFEEGKQVYLASLEPQYYSIKEIGEKYKIESQGFIHRLVLKTSEGK